MLCLTFDQGDMKKLIWSFNT